MTRLVASGLVRRPVKEVWAILADIGSISTWNSNITRSYLLPGAENGLGAARHCDVEGGYFKERVAEWKEGKTLGFRVFEMSAPMRSMTGTFHLRDAAGGTEVDFVVDYEMKLGLLGRLIDRIVVRRQLTKGLPRVIEGLRREAEGAAA